METKDEIKRGALDYINKTDWVSFPELQGKFENSKGDVAIFVPGLEAFGEAVFWSGMSEDFAAAVQELLQEKQIEAAPANLLIYIIDGGCLSIPIMKRIPKKPFKGMKWLPIALRPAGASSKKRPSRR